MSATDPYLLLGIDEDVTDQDVTEAYHHCLRRFPPENAPEVFSHISEAYESIRTEALRISRRLFPPVVPRNQIASYFDELPDTAQRLPPIKRDAWLRDAGAWWLRSKLT